MYCGQHPVLPYTQLTGSFIKVVLMLRIELKEAEMPAESEASVSCLLCRTHLANSSLESMLKYYCKEKKDH